MMNSECGVCFGKYVLCIFNFIFFVLGTLVLGSGIWLAADRHSLMALIKMVNSEYVNKFSQPHVIDQLIIVLILIGMVMFMISFLGYCGAITESRCMLTTYGLLLLLLLLIEVIATGTAVFYKKTAYNETKYFLETTISRYYTNIEEMDAVTLMWNQIMSSFACCGVNNYNDFSNAPHWMSTRGNRTIPEACCILKDHVNMIPVDVDCVFNPTDTNSYMYKGCYGLLTDWIITNRKLIIVILLSVGVFHALVICLVVCLCKSFNNYNNTMRL